MGHIVPNHVVIPAHSNEGVKPQPAHEPNYKSTLNQTLPASSNQDQTTMTNQREVAQSDGKRSQKSAYRESRSISTAANPEIIQNVIVARKSNIPYSSKFSQKRRLTCNEENGTRTGQSFLSIPTVINNPPDLTHSIQEEETRISV